MQFNVLALDARQQVVALTLEAANDTLAADQARAKGLSVVSVEAKGFRLGLPRRSVRFPVMLFSAELVSLLDAGLNLVEALQTLAEKERRAEGQQVLSQILAAIHRGEPLSQAIAGLPEQFSPLYVATIKAAERSGNVREALGRYIAYQEEIDRVKKKIVSASIYPAILMGVGGLVLAFLMFYVVPRFAKVYEDTAGTLPFFSKLLMTFGNFIGNNVVVLGLAFAGLIGGALYAVSRPDVRAWLNVQLWRIPSLGSRMKVYQLARRDPGGARARHGARPARGASAAAAGPGPEKNRAGRGDVGRVRRRRPGHAGRRPHDGGGRAQRRHGPHARRDRALPRRRGGAR